MFKSLLIAAVSFQTVMSQFGQQMSHYCNNPNGCGFTCTQNNRCQGVYTCGPNTGSLAGTCAFSCVDNDSCHDAIFVSQAPGRTEFNCAGENSCHQAQVYCGDIPPGISHHVQAAPTAKARANQQCSLICGKNSCHDMLVSSIGAKGFTVRASSFGGGGISMMDSQITCIAGKQPGAKCEAFCGSNRGGGFEPQCQNVRFNCPNGGCKCQGGGCRGVFASALRQRIKAVPAVTKKAAKIPKKSRPKAPAAPVVPKVPMIPPYGGFGQQIDCDQASRPCAGRMITCMSDVCQYDCIIPGACAGTTFVSSAMTVDLEVKCKKHGACHGLKVVSGAQTTKMVCDDLSCTGIKLHCIAKTGYAQLCELQCQNNGCQAGRGRMNAPGGGSAVMENEVQCHGNVQDCIVKAQHNFSFMGGKFVCDVNVGSRCLLECSDSWGEVSCARSQYFCNSYLPSSCMCKDQLHNNFINPIFGPRNPIVGVSSDCPNIIYPTTTGAPTTTSAPTTAVPTTAAPTIATATPAVFTEILKTTVAPSVAATTGKPTTTTLV